MKIKIEIKNAEKNINIELEKEINIEGKFKGYRFKNKMHNITDDIVNDFLEITFEILDGKFKGIHSYSDLYFEEEIEIKE